MSEPFVGEIKMFAGNFAPRGFAFCDGQLLQIQQYQALFSLIGTFYGGDGRTTLGLPDMRGRLPVHQGQGPGLSNRRIGERGGQENVTLQVSNIPAHRHAMVANSGTAVFDAPAGNVVADTGANPSYVDETPDDFMRVTTTSGGSQQHNNLMPFQCINFIIALTGVFPSRQ